MSAHQLVPGVAGTDVGPVCVLALLVAGVFPDTFVNVCSTHRLLEVCYWKS